LSMLNASDIHPIGNERYFAGVQWVAKKTNHVVFDPESLEVVKIFPRPQVARLLDCDLESEITVEVANDTAVIITNQRTQESRVYSNPNILNGYLYKARILSGGTECLILADDGGEILNVATAKPVLPSYFVVGRPYSELLYGVRTMSPKISLMGDVLAARGQTSACVVLREDLSRFPEYVDVDEFAFYGFDTDENVAFLTKDGEYVVTDKMMRVDRRYRLTEDSSKQSCASLSSESKRLLVLYVEDRLEMYDVSAPVSVGSENSTETTKQNILWPSHRPLTISGTISGVYDALGRDQMSHFFMTSTGDSTVVFNESSLKGLFIVVVSTGEVCAVLCE